jgi:hypothetical protein
MSRPTDATGKAHAKEAAPFHLYPILFAAFPVLSVYVSNRHELPLTVLWAPLVGAGATAALLVYGLRLALGPDGRHAVHVSALCVSLFSYGPIAHFLPSLVDLAQNLPESAWLFRIPAIAGTLPLGLLAWISRRRRAGRSTPQYVQRIAVGLLGLLLITTGAFALFRFGVIPPIAYVGETAVLAAWATFACGVMGFALSRSHVHPLAHRVMENIGWCLILVTAAPIVYHSATGTGGIAGRGAPGAPPALPSDHRAPDEPPVLPDILHLVFDAYASPASLESVFGYDAGLLLTQLEERGFSVARDGSSSYYLTPLSLASTFNYEHLHSSDPSDPWHVTSIAGALASFWSNRLFQRLEALGYTIYATESGFMVTDLLPVDVPLRSPFFSQRRFLTLLSELTAWRPLRAKLTPGRIDPYAETRRRVTDAFELMASIADQPSPKFLLAHFPTPHLPIIFDENAEDFLPDPEFVAMTRSRTSAPPASYKDYYRDYYPRQVEGVNRLIMRMLDELLPRLTHPTVIILQGDHGSELEYLLTRPTLSAMKERYSALNAVRFAGPRPEAFGEDTSLVNTYRIVLNEYFGESLPLIEDRFFFHRSRRGGISLIDVTDELDGTAPPRILRADYDSPSRSLPEGIDKPDSVE